MSTAFDAAAAGGSVDTAVGFPKSREEMYEFYGFIRKQTRDSASQEGGELECSAIASRSTPIPPGWGTGRRTRTCTGT